MTYKVTKLTAMPEWGLDDDMGKHYLADVTDSDGAAGQVAVAYGVRDYNQDQARRTHNIAGMSEWFIPQMDCAVDESLRGIEIADIEAQLGTQA